MKKLQNLGKVLSKAEQKRIVGGGYGTTIYCWCTEQVGCWSDTTSSSVEEAKRAIAVYCKGGGDCDTTDGCPW